MAKKRKGLEQQRVGERWNRKEKISMETERRRGE